LELLIAASRAALVNSRVAVLEAWAAAGMLGAGLAARVASNASRLISSLSAGQALLRWLVVALAAAVAVVSAGPSPAVAAGGALASAAVLGLAEFLCGNAVLRAPERWAVRLAPIASAAVWLFRPIGWAGQRLSAFLAGPDAGRERALVTEEEIMTLVDAGEEGGVIEEEEKAMIYSIFRLGDTLARELMVPRIDILAFESSTPLDEAADGLLKAGHSRAPVFARTIDNVIGLLYAKDLLAALREGASGKAVGELAREPFFVPEAKKVDDLLAEMQAKRVHMAIVVDEYGGTAGVVTIEDIVEEIVGEIQDEYDATEEPPYQRHPDGSYTFSGRIPLDDAEQVLGVELPKEAGDSLGGLVYSRLGRVPAAGEVVETDGLRLVVEQVSGRRIRKVRAARAAAPAVESENHEKPSSSTQ
jgi:CBS domain containing-hemolysin-like protein